MSRIRDRKKNYKKDLKHVVESMHHVRTAANANGMHGVSNFPGLSDINYQADIHMFLFDGYGALTGNRIEYQKGMTPDELIGGIHALYSAT